MSGILPKANKRTHVRHLGKPIRFLFVGATTYLLTMLAFELVHSQIPGNPNVSATGSYFIGTAYHFTMNRLFTFRNRHDPLIPQLLKYAALTTINYLLTLSLFQIMIRQIHARPLIPFALSVAATTVTGYLVMQFWVFARQQH